MFLNINLPATGTSLSSLLLCSSSLYSLLQLPICVGTPHHSQLCYLSTAESSSQVPAVIFQISPFLRSPIPRVTRLSVFTAPVALPEISAPRTAIVLGMMDTYIEVGVRTSLGSRRTALKSVDIVRTQLAHPQDKCLLLPKLCLTSSQPLLIATALCILAH